jgi:cellulase
MKTLLVPLVIAAQVSAHGYVTGIVAEGKYFMGYTPNFQYMNPKPKVPSWSAGGYGHGGIQPNMFNKVRPFDSFLSFAEQRDKSWVNWTGQVDIVCHDNPKPGEAYAEIRAGSTIQVQWSPW